MSSIRPPSAQQQIRCLLQQGASEPGRLAWKGVLSPQLCLLTEACSRSSAGASFREKVACSSC
jgi:hypothetical protein